MLGVVLLALAALAADAEAAVFGQPAPVLRARQLGSRTSDPCYTSFTSLANTQPTLPAAYYSWEATANAECPPEPTPGSMLTIHNSYISAYSSWISVHNSDLSVFFSICGTWLSSVASGEVASASSDIAAIMSQELSCSSKMATYTPPVTTTGTTTTKTSTSPSARTTATTTTASAAAGTRRNTGVSIVFLMMGMLVVY
ncbi:hypothetical protein BX600DRAFT_476866 [Xylariales sp. PMI_506]|nr:hypothetical protein BX600DRAFT_476866 [Xylariales sp. PMI_506]